MSEFRIRLENEEIEGNPFKYISAIHVEMADGTMIELDASTLGFCRYSLVPRMLRYNLLTDEDNASTMLFPITHISVVENGEVICLDECWFNGVNEPRFNSTIAEAFRKAAEAGCDE